MDTYILTHSICKNCVWSEKGFYNPKCCHCKYVTFGKSKEPNFMTREMAEELNLIKIKKDEVSECRRG